MPKDGAYGVDLCDALMKIFGAGAHELPAIVEQLAQTKVAPYKASTWTADALCAALKAYAKPPAKPSVTSPVSSASPQGNDGGQLPALQPKITSPEALSDYLVRFGLRNQWYIVAASSEVTEKPLAITRLNERMVLWRDAQGVVHALEDRCPHRGVALSAGETHDQVIACAYHGVQVDGSGRIAKVPAIANCPLEGRHLLRHYPIIEHYQAIWAYFGDEKHPQPPPLDLPDELTSPEWSGMLHNDVWNTNYNYIYDNLCDPMHGRYLHGRTYTQQYGPKSDVIKINPKDDSFEVFLKGQHGVNVDWLEMVHTDSSYYFRIEVPLPATAGPGGFMGIVFYITPVDDRQTYVAVWRIRKVSGWRKDLWHFLFDHRLRGFANTVLAQDEEAMAQMPPWPADAENLYQHDIGVAHMRRHIRKAAQSQARALYAETP